MTEVELKLRTKRFAIDIVNLVDGLPRERVTDHIGRQILRSGTSVAANYRAACRGRSDAEMAAKLGIVEEEADETQFWLEPLTETGRAGQGLTRPLIQEADEIVRMVVASIKTIKGRPSSTRVREVASLYDTMVEESSVSSFPAQNFPLHTPQ